MFIYMFETTNLPVVQILFLLTVFPVWMRNEESKDLHTYPNFCKNPLKLILVSVIQLKTNKF